MNKDIRQFPVGLNFISDVLAELTKDNYELSVDLFMEGLQKIVISHHTITLDEFEYVFRTLEVFVKYKLQQYAPKSEGQAATKKLEQLSCSYCGKIKSDVTQLIAGAGAYICDACVNVCNKILEEISKKK